MPKVVIEGLEKAMKKLGPELYSDALRTFWRQAADEVMKETAQGSPSATGKLKGSLDVGGPGNVFDVAHMNPPEWARVGTNVENKGFRYPWALEAGERYHFRSALEQQGLSKGGGKGPQTKGWFSEAFTRALGGVRQRLQPMIEAIAKAWEE